MESTQGREHWLAIVNRRLERVQNEQNCSAVTESGALEDAKRLHETLPSDKLDLRANLTLGWFYWYRSIAIEQSADQHQQAIDFLTPCFIYGAEPLPARFLPTLADHAVPTAAWRLERAMKTPQGDAIVGVVELCQRINHHITQDCAMNMLAMRLLGIALRVRFERFGTVADINDSIKASLAAVEAIPHGHHARPAALADLGTALRMRFSRTGELRDLDDANRITQEAVTTTPADDPDRAGWLSNLTIGLRLRYERTGNLAELDEAIKCGRIATETAPINDANWSGSRTNLGMALQARFERTAAIADLNEAIECNRAAAEVTPTDSPELAGRLSNLALAVRERFERTGNRVDIDEAVAVGRDAVAASMPSDPHLAGRLSNLGVTLRVRFERAGDTADLNEAIANNRAAVDATPTDHPSWARRAANLGNALHIRFARTGELADIDQAIAYQRAAVANVGEDDPNRAGWLLNLGAALDSRFKATGHTSDIDEAIASNRAALEVTPHDDARRLKMLTNLGNSLRLRFERTSDFDDLNEAIETSEAAVKATPANHPDLPGRLSNLGLARRARFASLGNDADRARAVSAFVGAVSVETAAPSARVGAALGLLNIYSAADCEVAATALETAVELLGECAAIHLERGDRQHALGRFGGLAAEAVASLLSVSERDRDDSHHRAARAVRLLEQGRSILVSQALETRTDLTDLRAQHPTLADEFVSLRAQLDAPSESLTDRSARDGLITAYRDTLEFIRSLPGLSDFLRPPTAYELMSQAIEGPIAVLNVAARRSDALLVCADKIVALPLTVPEHADDSVRRTPLTRALLTEQINCFHSAMRICMSGETPVDERLDVVT